MKNSKFYYLINNIKKRHIIIKFSLIIFLFLCKNIMYIQNNNNFPNINVTLVSAFYNLSSSKHSYQEYLEWINNLFQLNTSIVFFTDKSMINIVKNIRPQIYKKKTKFIEIEIKDFYSYRNFYKEFSKTYKLDSEYFIHNHFYILYGQKNVNSSKMQL